MKKVLVISSSYPGHEGDHAGHFVQSEVEALLMDGHDVRVMSPGRAANVPPDANTHITLGGTHLFRAPGAWPNLKRNPKLFIEFLRASAQAASWALAHRTSTLTGRFGNAAADFRPDRIIAHWLIPSAIPWGIFAHQNGVEFEVVVHGSDLQLLLVLPQLLQNILLQQLYRRGARVRFVSEALKSQLLARSLPIELMLWLNDAEVRAALLDVSTATSRADARVSLQLANGEVVLLIVGRMIHQKRMVEAISAASLVPGAQIFVVGEGPLRSQLETQFAAVNFLGTLPRETTLRWIAAADLLISASRLEGAPTTIREALALGTDVVSTEVADLSRWATSGSGLWLVA